MSAGYMGKILWVNLDQETTEETTISPEVARKYIGGTGMSAYLLMNYLARRPEHLPPDPFNEESPLIFLTGPLTGTKAPYSGRYSVVGRSPQTGIWGESDSGGPFGVQLKAAGYDGVIFLRSAKEPVYVWIDEKGVEIRRAETLWGKDAISRPKSIEQSCGCLCDSLAGCLSSRIKS